MALFIGLALLFDLCGGAPVYRPLLITLQPVACFAVKHFIKEATGSVSETLESDCPSNLFALPFRFCLYISTSQAGDLH